MQLKLKQLQTSAKLVKERYLKWLETGKLDGVCALCELDGEFDDICIICIKYNIWEGCNCEDWCFELFGRRIYSIMIDGEGSEEDRKKLALLIIGKCDRVLEAKSLKQLEENNA